MAKKNKNHKLVEELRGQIRYLKAQLKKCKNYEPDEDEEVDLDQCPVCGKGHLRVLDLIRVTYLVCDLCKHREKIG